MAAGSTVTFTYVVTNTGNVPLANVVVTDDKLGPITSFTGDTNGNGLLDLTETWTYTHDRHRPGRPADQHRHRHRPGRQHRHHGHRRQPGQLLRRRPGDQHRQVRQRPGRRHPDRAARGRGQHGDVHLRGDQHRQRPPGQRRRHRRQAGHRSPASRGDTNGNGLLDLTETWTYTQTATALAGQQTNIGTVTGQDANNPPGTTVTDNNPANYFGDAPAIHIVKFVNGQDADSPTGPHVAAGSTVTFTYVVTNTGNVPLANVAVTDDKLGPITSFTGDTNGNGLLDLTETWTYTADRHRPGRPADQRRHRHRPGPQHRHDGHRRQPGQLLRRRPGASTSSSSSTARTPTARPGRTWPRAAR